MVLAAVVRAQHVQHSNVTSSPGAQHPHQPWLPATQPLPHTQPPPPPPPHPCHTPQVILLKDVENVGKEGELLTVPVGYLRNYLLPNGVARKASEGILE